MKYRTAEQNQKRESLLAGVRILATILLLSISIPSSAQLIFEKEEYAVRREKLMDQIPDGFLVIRGAAMPSNYTQF